MKSYGYHVQPDQIRTILSGMVGEFRASELIEHAVAVGIPRSIPAQLGTKSYPLGYAPAMRVVDRLLQAERIAGRIQPRGKGIWRRL